MYGGTAVKAMRKCCDRVLVRFESSFPVFVIIQGVPGGKINILGGHSIGNSKHVSYSERFPRYSYFTVQFKIVDKNDILRTVSNTGIYCSRDS
jgi:hypothetical protein